MKRVSKSKNRIVTLFIVHSQTLSNLKKIIFPIQVETSGYLLVSLRRLIQSILFVYIKLLFYYFCYKYFITGMHHRLIYFNVFFLCFSIVPLVQWRRYDRNSTIQLKWYKWQTYLIYYFDFFSSQLFYVFNCISFHGKYKSN